LTKKNRGKKSRLSEHLKEDIFSVQQLGFFKMTADIESLLMNIPPRNG
jgi:hypothetical protein